MLFRLINGTKRETATARPNTLLVNQENRFVPTDYLSFRRPSRARSLEKKTNKTQTTPVDRTLLARIRLRTCNCRRDVTRVRIPTLHGRSSGPTSEKKKYKNVQICSLSVKRDSLGFSSCDLAISTLPICAHERFWFSFDSRLRPILTPFRPTDREVPRYFVNVYRRRNAFGKRDCVLRISHSTEKVGVTCTMWRQKSKRPDATNGLFAPI